MKPTSAPTLLSLAVLTQLSAAQDSSALFSQYIGATTATADFSGPSASDQSFSLTVCTNYLHGLAAIPTNLPATALAALVQVQVDGVCEICTSVSQSRIDSCCAVSTSVDCFDKFTAGGGAAQTTPAAAGATTTPGSSSATMTGTTPAATSSKSSGEKVDVVCFQWLSSSCEAANLCVRRRLLDLYWLSLAFSDGSCKSSKKDQTPRPIYRREWPPASGSI